MNLAVSSLCCLLLAAQHAQAFLPNPTYSSTTAPSTELHAHAADRRAFVTGGIGAATTLFLPQVAPVHAADAASVDYKAVAKDIMDLVEKNPDWGPSKLTPDDVI